MCRAAKRPTAGGCLSSFTLFLYVFAFSFWGYSIVREGGIGMGGRFLGGLILSMNFLVGPLLYSVFEPWALRVRGRSALGESGLALTPLVTRYTRPPSTFLETRFSLRRLRTTPVRNPRTECCCQPVPFIIAAMVTPAGDCNIVSRRDCFEAGLTFFVFGLPTVGCECFAAEMANDFAVNRLFADFDIETLHSVHGNLRRTTEAPPRR